MVMSEGLLGSHKSITSGTFNVYECPADKYAKVIVNVSADVVGNTGCVLHISPTSTPTEAHTFQKENLNSINNGFIRTAVILTEGEWLSYTTTGAGINISVIGLEYTTNTKEIATTSLVTTNTEVVLYEAPVDETVTINTTVSAAMTGVNSATTKLYVSSTNASGGTLLVTNNINAGRSGFEYTGLSLSDGQKLILVTTNIVGQLATRVHGFRRDVQ